MLLVTVIYLFFLLVLMSFCLGLKSFHPLKQRHGHLPSTRDRQGAELCLTLPVSKEEGESIIQRETLAGFEIKNE